MAVWREMKKTVSFGVPSVGGSYDAFNLTVTTRSVVLSKGGKQPLKMAETAADIRRRVAEYREVLDEIEKEVNAAFPLPPDAEVRILESPTTGLSAEHANEVAEAVVAVVDHLS